MFYYIAVYDALPIFVDSYVALKEVTETLNVNIYDDPGLIKVIVRAKGKELNGLNDDQKLKYAKIGCGRMMGMHLLMGADHDRFKSAIKEFEHAYLMDKRNNYPKTLHDCYTLLKGWKKGNNHQQNPNRVGVSFNTIGEDNNGTMLATKGNTYSGTPCAQYGRTNHPIDKCFAKRHVNGDLLHIEVGVGDEWEESEDDVSIINPRVNKQKETSALTLLQSNYNRTAKSNTSSNAILDTWILLDSQSTIDVFCNEKLLSQIHATNTIMNITCNAGVKRTNLQGHISGYGWVWFFS